MGLTTPTLALFPRASTMRLHVQGLLRSYGCFLGNEHDGKILLKSFCLKEATDHSKAEPTGVVGTNPWSRGLSFPLSALGGWDLSPQLSSGTNVLQSGEGILLEGRTLEIHRTDRRAPRRSVGSASVPESGVLCRGRTRPAPGSLSPPDMAACLPPTLPSPPPRLRSSGHGSFPTLFAE